jgi:hypothetical protein
MQDAETAPLNVRVEEVSERVGISEETLRRMGHMIGGPLAATEITISTMWDGREGIVGSVFGTVKHGEKSMMFCRSLDEGLIHSIIHSPNIEAELMMSTLRVHVLYDYRRIKMEEQSALTA